jgi:uncharacterized protein (PEP-CTERM system associated)
MIPECRRMRPRALLLAATGLAALSAAPCAWGQASGGLSPVGTPGGSLGGGGGTPTLQAPNGSLLPPLGTDPTAPGLRDRLNDIFGFDQQSAPTSASAGPSWQFKPQVTVSGEFTDNASAAGGVPVGTRVSAGADFITLIQPQLQILNTSDRVSVNLLYNPTAEIYAVNNSYSQFRQQGNGDVLGTIFPDLLYLDLRGSITQQPLFGGFGAVNIDTLPPNEQETLSSLSISPYASHSFGGTGTLQAGVGYIYSATEAPSDFNQQNLLPIGLAQAYGNSWLATKRIFGNFATGEDFGRFQNVLSTDNNFYDGSGALKSAQRVTVTDDASYAVNRFVSVLGEIGYENLSYPNAGFAYVGGVWAGGLRLTPNANSSVTLQYRHIDGVSAPYVYGTWQATPRLRIYGGYSEGITSFDQDQQNTLLSGTNTQTGVAASALFAAPVLNNANYFGGNQTLNRSRRLNAAAVYVLDRDTLTASFDWQRSSQVGNPQGLSSSLLANFGLTPDFLTYVLLHGIPSFVTGFERHFLTEVLQFETLSTDTTTNIVGGLTWQHDLRPDLSMQIYGGYAQSRQAYTTNQVQDFALVSATVTYKFSDTLTGHATFAGHYDVGSAASTEFTNENDSTFTVSLTKTF